MPFRKAHWYVVVLLATTFVAFWPRYFSQLPGGRPDWHVHAAGALLWVLLVILQSWSIQTRRRTLHRSAGLASFVVFPVFLIGGVMAIQAEAADLATGIDNPGNALIGPFGFFDPLAIIGFTVLFHGGIKHRHTVQLHSRYMIATLLFLIEPIVMRLLSNNIPFFEPGNPDMIYRLAYAVAAGNVVAMATALFFYRRASRFGRPFLIVAGFVAAQEVLFETIGRTDEWAILFSQLASVSTAVLLVATGLVSVAVIWHAWLSGNRPGRSTAAAIA